MLLVAGRRLALLNTLVVVAVIAVTGLATMLLLRQSLDAAADRTLAERVQVGRERWADRFVTNVAPAAQIPAPLDSPGPPDDEFPRGDDNDGDDEARELLASGDILLIAVDAGGRVIANSRGLAVPGLPDAAGVAAALAGRLDTHDSQIAGERVRIYTEPVVREDQVRGAIQAIRSARELDEDLRLAGVMSLAGVCLGALVALPVGLFLAQRALHPIAIAFEQQRTFVADASHELRTPLTLIRATIELAQRLPEASPGVREELGSVLEEIDATNRLVDDLLMLARLDAAAVPQQDELDLGQVVADAAAFFVPVAEAAGLELTVAGLPVLPVRGDADHLRRVTRILLANAIAYTPAPGSVWVSGGRERDRVVIRVRDTGIGIPLAEQERVFDRFYRADPARARATGGAGLGLAIAREIVVGHGGEIGLQSGPQGSTVWFSIPLAAARAVHGAARE